MTNVGTGTSQVLEHLQEEMTEMSLLYIDQEAIQILEEIGQGLTTSLSIILLMCLLHWPQHS